MKPFKKPTNEVENVGHDHQLAEVQNILLQHAKEYVAQNANAKNTIRAYVNNWNEFESWCNTKGFNPLPATPVTVALYLYDLSKNGNGNGPLAVSSIQQRIYAINFRHKSAGHPSPTRSFEVSEMIKSIKNERGVAPKKKQMADIEIIKAICKTIPDDLTGIRDRALLLTGFGFGSRRSELIGVDVEHISYKQKGMEILIPKSKTDQEGKGRSPLIFWGEYPETCPVRALQKWLRVSVITSGPVFRKIDKHGNISNKRLSADGFRHIFSKLIEKAGFNKSDFSPHSIRHGFIFSARVAGKDEHAIMSQTGHKSVEVMRGYIDESDKYINNATDGIGL